MEKAIEFTVLYLDLPREKGKLRFLVFCFTFFFASSIFFYPFTFNLESEVLLL